MASNAENVSIWWRHHVDQHSWSYFELTKTPPYFASDPKFRQFIIWRNLAVWYRERTVMMWPTLSLWTKLQPRKQSSWGQPSDPDGPHELCYQRGCRQTIHSKWLIRHISIHILPDRLAVLDDQIIDPCVAVESEMRKITAQRLSINPLHAKYFRRNTNMY